MIRYAKVMIAVSIQMLLVVQLLDAMGCLVLMKTNDAVSLCLTEVDGIRKPAVLSQTDHLSSPTHTLDLYPLCLEALSLTLYALSFVPARRDEPFRRYYSLKISHI